MNGRQGIPNGNVQEGVFNGRIPGYWLLLIEHWVVPALPLPQCYHNRLPSGPARDSIGRGRHYSRSWCPLSSPCRDASSRPNGRFLPTRQPPRRVPWGTSPSSRSG